MRLEWSGVPTRNIGGKAVVKPLTAGVPSGRTCCVVLGIIRGVRSLKLPDPLRPVPTRIDNGVNFDI